MKFHQSKMAGGAMPKKTLKLKSTETIRQNFLKLLTLELFPSQCSGFLDAHTRTGTRTQPQPVYSQC